jgi:hypothetical protein
MKKECGEQLISVIASAYTVTDWTCDLVFRIKV